MCGSLIITDGDKDGRGRICASHAGRNAERRISRRIWAVPKPARESHWHFPQSHRRDRQQSAPHHRRYGAPAWALLRQQPGILDELAGALRPEGCAEKPETYRRKAHQVSACGLERLTPYL